VRGFERRFQLPHFVSGPARNCVRYRQPERLWTAFTAV